MEHLEFKDCKSALFQYKDLQRNEWQSNLIIAYSHSSNDWNKCAENDPMIHH